MNNNNNNNNNNNKENLLNILSQASGFKLSRKDAHSLGKCVCCGLIASERCQTKTGKDEWRISGLCEICFDEMYGEPTERMFVKKPTVGK